MNHVEYDDVRREELKLIQRMLVVRSDDVVQALVGKEIFGKFVTDHNDFRSAEFFHQSRHTPGSYDMAEAVFDRTATDKQYSFFFDAHFVKISGVNGA